MYGSKSDLQGHSNILIIQQWGDDASNIRIQ